MACEMSDRRLPGRACSAPRSVASSVTRISRSTFRGAGADGNGPRRIAVVAVLHGHDVELYDVARFDPPLARNAVHDFFVDGHAKLAGETKVVERPGPRAVPLEGLLGDPV